MGVLPDGDKAVSPSGGRDAHHPALGGAARRAGILDRWESARQTPVPPLPYAVAGPASGEPLGDRKAVTETPLASVNPSGFPFPPPTQFSAVVRPPRRAWARSVFANEKFSVEWRIGPLFGSGEYSSRRSANAAARSPRSTDPSAQIFKLFTKRPGGIAGRLPYRRDIAILLHLRGKR